MKRYLLSKLHLIWVDKKYWEFSFDEMSKFDLPACIDYILNVTNRSKLMIMIIMMIINVLIWESFWLSSFDFIFFSILPESLAYIGHSQGTAIMFGLLSMQPHFSQIINPFIALAPVTSVGHMTTPLKNLAPLKSLLR